MWWFVMGRPWQSHMASLQTQPSRRAALRQLAQSGQAPLSCYLGAAKAW
jgi:hypothetical protein